MTSSRALAIITVAILPLAALTARGFFAAPASGNPVTDLPTYTAGGDELSAARKVAAEPGTVPADPVGWGLPRKTKPSDEPVEYQAAAVLAAAGRAAAAKGDAIAEVTAAVTDIGGLLAEPRRAEIQALAGGQGLLESLQARQAGLQRHSKWLEDRADIARRVTALEALLAGPPDGANESKCLAEITAAGVQFPEVADDDDADEPPNARTKSEQRVLERIRFRASFRQEQHAAMTAADPEGKLRLLEAFLKEHASSSDSRDARLVEEAQRELGVARLAVLRAQAERAETADAMAKALKKWLDAPPAGPDNRKAEATAVIKTWLTTNVPAPPEVAALPKLRKLQETIMVAAGDEEQRMLGAFAPTPNQPGKWRYWRDRQDQKDEYFKRGRGDVEVPAAKPPLKIPAFVDIEATYDRDRQLLLEDPLGEGVAEAFAQKSSELAVRTAEHSSIPANTNAAHELQGDYDTLGEMLKVACRKAAAAAREFEAAAEENALRSLQLP